MLMKWARQERTNAARDHLHVIFLKIEFEVENRIEIESKSRMVVARGWG